MALALLDPTPAPAIERLVDDYLANCRARGLSPRTLANSYGYPLREVFLPFCARQEVIEPSELSSRLLDRLSAELMDTGGKRGPLSKHSIRTYMTAVNQFLRWLERSGGGTEARAQLPRLPKKLVEVLSRAEVQALEDAATTERDKLIVRVLANTGMRVGELVLVELDDIVEVEGKHCLMVTGKGSQDRLVPIPEEAVRLRRFITRIRPASDSRRLFLSLRRSRAGLYEPLTTSGVEQLLKVLAATAGIQKRVYPHLLRHSLATHWIARGGNPVALANLLGHANLVMIHQVYSHLAAGDLYDATAQILERS